MFKRKILSKLEAWKQDERHKPLILRGARQVGKTTVVNEFGSQFDNYLYFNLEMSESVRLFEMDIPLNDLVNMLFASLGKSQKEGSTLIFIDEIQNSPKTIALLRYFYEQRSRPICHSRRQFVGEPCRRQCQFPGRKSYVFGIASLLFL